MSANNYEGEFDIPSGLGEARRVQDQIEKALQATGYTDHGTFSAKLALEEAIVNAIRHGNLCDPGKRVRIRYQVTPDHYHFRINDEGAADPS